ncbi:MAG: hypothetical protein ACFFDT_35630 [Candidatus Hodarchaeota archaeon]
MKKLITLFLVFSILAFSGNMYAEKTGADLIIQRTDGTQVRGELIAVKENSLLLLERDSGADMSVDSSEIRVIRIKKKSNFSQGFTIGFLAGGAGGATWMAAQGAHPKGYLIIGGGLAVAGGLLGGLIGSATGSGERTIQINGKSDSEIQKILEELRKKARVPHYQ